MIFDELLKLLPFYFSQILYWFIWYIPSEQPGVITLVIKCLPVFFLTNYLKNTTSYKDGNFLVQWLTKGKHSLIRGVLIQSCPTGATNFTNCVFCHPQFSGVIQNIENRCAIRAKFLKFDF